VYTKCIYQYLIAFIYSNKYASEKQVIPHAHSKKKRKRNKAELVQGRLGGSTG